MSDSATTTNSTKIYALSDHQVESTFTGANYRELDMIDFTGDSQSHYNISPYLAIYLWKRLA